MNINDLTNAVKRIYAPYFDSEYLNKNLVIPQIYIDSIDKIYFKDLFSLSDMLIGTSNWAQVFASDFLERKNSNLLTTGDKIFLVIGEWGSRHDFLMCCDKSSPDFEKVFDANDAHPWMRENDWEQEWTDFSTFVKDEFKIELK